MSMLPCNYQDLVDDADDRRGPFLITQNTKVTFLARRYRLVFVLDLSPSLTTVVSRGIGCVCGSGASVRFLISFSASTPASCLLRSFQRSLSPSLAGHPVQPSAV